MISRLFSVFYGIFVVAQIDFKSLRINSGFLIFPLLHSRKAKHTAGVASNPEKGGKTMMKMKEEAPQVQKIVSNCCNWDKGICLLLGFPCPQQLSLTRINCIFFREVELPDFPELFEEMKKYN